MSNSLSLDLVLNAQAGGFTAGIKTGEVSLENFTKATNKAANSTDKLNETVEQFSKKNNQSNESLKKNNKTVKSFAKAVGVNLYGGIKKAIRVLPGLKRKVKDVGNASKKAKSSVGGFGKALKLLGPVIAAVSIGALAGQLFDGINAMQGFEAQLKTVAGTAGGAALELDRLVEFAKKTPFTIEQSVEAFSKLTHLGLNPSEEAMMSYGNTASAMGKDMMQMVEAVADASVGEFERLKEFGIKSKNQGDTIAFTFQGNTKVVKNGAAEIEQYLQDLGNNQFAGAMSDQMQTLGAKTSNVGIEMQVLSQKMGDAGLTAIFGLVIDKVSEIVSSTTEWITSSDTLTSVMSEGGAIIADILQALYVTTKQIELGWLMLAEAVVGAMASSADAVAELINIALDPLTDALSFIAESWANLLSAAAEFTGSQMMADAAKSLNSFSASVKDFSVSGDDIRQLNENIGQAVATTSKEINNLKKVSAGDTVRKWFKKNVAAVNEQKKAAKELAKQNKKTAEETGTVGKQAQYSSTELDKLISEMDKMAESGSNAGDVMTRAFGSIASNIDKMSEAMGKYGVIQKGFDDDRKKINAISDLELRQKELAKLDAAEEKMNENRLSSTVGSFAAITGAAKSMFSEQSKGREALHKMEQVFTVIEVALSIQKAAASAMAAIAGQGQGDPYTAFARIAAMAALMAGLGLFSGSVGSAPATTEERQASQGTGSLLGSDDKSQSLSNSFERMMDIEAEQYSELREMNKNLKDLNGFIGKLAVNLVNNFGKFDDDSYGGQLGSKSTTSSLEGFLIGGIAGKLDPTGIVSGIISSFSKTKKTLIDSGISIISQTLGEVIDSGMLSAQAYFDIKTKKSSFWGLSSSNSYNTEYQDVDSGLQREFAMIFTSIGSSINEAIDVLGISVATEVQGATSGWADFFENEFDEDSLFGDYFSDRFSGFGDQLGGVLGDEVNRSLDNFVIDLPNISLEGLSGEEIEAELQAVFSQQADLMVEYLVPGIAAFQQMGEGLYETLIRVAQEQTVFNYQLDALGLSLDRFGGVTAEMSLEIAQSIITLTGGLEQFKEYTSEYFSEFFSDSEQFNYLSQNIQKQFESLDIQLPVTRDDFRALVEGIDLTTESGQELFASLMALVPAMDEFYDHNEALANQIESMNDSLERQLARFDMSPLEIAIQDINDWREAAIESSAALGNTDFSLIEAIAARQREDIARNSLETIVSESEQQMDQLTANFDSSVTSLNNTFNALIDSIHSTSQSIQSSILSIKQSMPGFDNVAYYSNEVSDLRSQLGDGDVESQLAIIERIKTAIGNRYSAEQVALSENSAQSVAQYEAQEQRNKNAFDEAKKQADEIYNNEQTIYQSQLSSIKSLKKAAESLKKAADSLLLSDLSTLTLGEQLTEAKAQFEQLKQRANNGDAEAYSQVAGAGKQYLKLAQQFSPSDYGNVFDSVQNTFESLGNKTFIEPSAPAPHSSTAEYQANSLAFQDLSTQLDASNQALALSTVAELETLQQLTDDLAQQANSELNDSVGSLQEQYALDSQLIVDTLQSEIQALIDVLPEETNRLLASMESQNEILNTLLNSLVVSQNSVSEMIKHPPLIKPIVIEPIVIHPLPPEQTIQPIPVDLGELHVIFDEQTKELKLSRDELKKLRLELKEQKAILQSTSQSATHQSDQLQQLNRDMNNYSNELMNIKRAM